MISIHTALAGCDPDPGAPWFIHTVFQSTQPSQAVTLQDISVPDMIKISIHTALAGCDGVTPAIKNKLKISIHTALAGCDPALRKLMK